MSTYLTGVEAPLPEGERVLWQGSPGRNALALHAFHARKIAIYFVALIALSGAFAQSEPDPMKFFLSSAKWLFMGGAMATLFAYTVAALSSRTTLYAITERRVVMKVGIALPVVLNIPLHIIDAVDVKRRSDGSGDLALRLGNNSRVAYAVLWPHARAWHVRYPQPLLRGLPNIDAIGATLRDALMSSAVGVENSVATEKVAPAIAVGSPAGQSPVFATS